MGAPIHQQEGPSLVRFSVEPSTIEKPQVETKPAPQHAHSPRERNLNQPVNKEPLAAAKAGTALEQTKENRSPADAATVANGKPLPKLSESELATFASKIDTSSEKLGDLGKILQNMPNTPEAREQLFQALKNSAKSDEDILKIASAMAHKTMQCTLFLKFICKGPDHQDDPDRLIALARKMDPAHNDFAATVIKTSGKTPGELFKLAFQMEEGGNAPLALSLTNALIQSSDVNVMEFLKTAPLEASTVIHRLYKNGLPVEKLVSKLEDSIKTGVSDAETNIPKNLIGLKDISDSLVKLTKQIEETPAGEKQNALLKAKIAAEKKYEELYMTNANLINFRNNILGNIVSMNSLDTSTIKRMIEYKTKLSDTFMDSIDKFSKDNQSFRNNNNYTTAVNKLQTFTKVLNEHKTKLSSKNEEGFLNSIRENKGVLTSINESLTKKLSQPSQKLLIAFHKPSVDAFSQILQDHRPYLDVATTVAKDAISLKSALKFENPNEIKRAYDNLKASSAVKYEAMGTLKFDQACIESVKAPIDQLLAQAETHFQT